MNFVSLFARRVIRISTNKSNYEKCKRKERLDTSFIRPRRYVNGNVIRTSLKRIRWVLPIVAITAACGAALATVTEQTLCNA
jgi:hypothetical protein